MKPVRITFIVLLIAFFIFWGIKVNLPVDRPSSLEEETQVAWYDRDYEHMYGDNEWYLSGNEQSYVQLEGYDSIYYVEQANGSYKYYKKSGDTYIEIEFEP